MYIQTKYLYLKMTIFLHYIHYSVDENIIKKYNIITADDYKKAILSKSADFIIYDNNNNAFLGFTEKEINDNYVKEYEYKNLIVFKNEMIY